MVAAACDRSHPYDLVIVHSFSRFFRDQFEFERYRRKLARAGVAIVSITQDVGEGAINRLYALVEQGLASPADTGFAARLADNRRRLVLLDAEIARAEQALDRCDRAITPAIVDRFGLLVKQALNDNAALRQGYARLLLKRVAIEDGAIVITGADTLIAATAA